VYSVFQHYMGYTSEAVIMRISSFTFCVTETVKTDGQPWFVQVADQPENESVLVSLGRDLLL